MEMITEIINVCPYPQDWRRGGEKEIRYEQQNGMDNMDWYCTVNSINNIC